MSHIGKKRIIRLKIYRNGQKKPSVPTYRSFQLILYQKMQGIAIVFSNIFQKSVEFYYFVSNVKNICFAGRKT